MIETRHGLAEFFCTITEDDGSMTIVLVIA